MTRPLLLLTRPVEETDTSRRTAEAAGFDVLVAPLLRVEPLQWTPPVRLPDSLLFTSARAPGFAAVHAPELRAIPAYAVGPRTAAAARASGFALEREGVADGNAILAAMAADGRRDILHLSGLDTAPLDIPPGAKLNRVPVYAARLLDQLPESVVDAMRNETIFAALLFSARTAARFRHLLTVAGNAPADMRIVALSEAVAFAAGEGWREVALAASPTLDAALVAARSLWQCSCHGR